jgi:hypothetical protein
MMNHEGREEGRGAQADEKKPAKSKYTKTGVVSSVKFESVKASCLCLFFPPPPPLFYFIVPCAFCVCDEFNS